MANSHTPSTLVLLPAYNAEAYLGEAVESVQAQTCSDWEMIIIDDASTDATGALAAGYANSDRRISVLTNESNRYLGYSKNRAVAGTQHEFLLMQDADDISLPDRLERSLGFLRSHPDLTMTGTNHILMDPKGRDCYPVWTLQQDSLDVRELLWAGTYLPLHPTWLVRRSAYEAIGGYDLLFKNCEDHDFLLRMALVGPIGLLSEPLMRYRTHGNKVIYQRLARQEVEREVLFERARALGAGEAYDLEGEFARRLETRLAEPHGQYSEEYTAQYNVAKMYLTTGDGRAARRHLWRALRSRPTRAGAYLGLLLSLVPPRQLRRLLLARQEHRQPPPEGRSWLK